METFHWKDTNYGLSHRLMLILLANNHIWEGTPLFSHFLLIMYDAYLHLSSENNFSYDSAKKVVHVLTFECNKIDQERIELRFPSLCSEEQEVEEKPPGSQEKANCPDDKVSREYEPYCHVF